MDCLNAVASSMVPLVVAPTVKHVMYPFKVGDNVRALESAKNTLVALMEDVKTSIKNAKRNGDTPTKQVEDWLGRVDGIEKEAKKILDDYRQPRRCLSNHSKNLCSNYKISRRAAKKLVDVKSLNDEKETIEVIMQQPPPLVQEMPASFRKSPHLDSTLHHIGNDKHGIIGIWGMGGVGKTHLLKQLHNELSQDHAFDVVMFITCSKQCSIEKIQDQIIERLGFSKSANMEHKARIIYNFLRERSFVLLLDDMWSRMDLEKVGIPNPNNLTGRWKRKIVLTTRLIEICRQMEVNKMIKVDVLNTDDAWSLFKEKVTEETLKSNPLIQKYAVGVIEQLGGLPLALITVGRAMRGVEDPSKWELTIKLLEEARLHDVEFAETPESVFHILKLSYDNLKPDLKKCFLHCSLWPEDCSIEKEDLVLVWIGLGLIDESDIRRAHLVGYNYIMELHDACLLEITGNENQVKMHDLIRDMAIWTANDQEVQEKRWIVQAGIQHKFIEMDVGHEVEKLSLMHNRTEKLSLSTHCSSKLSTLLLRRNKLCDLKAVQLDVFSQLTFLDLNRNSFTDFPIEICKLINLRFLDLSFNKIKSLPEELGDLINLKYLLLKWNMICGIPEGVVSKLVALKVLDLCGCQGIGEFITTLLEKLQYLPKFQALGISTTDPLQFQKITEAANVPIRWLHVLIKQQEMSSFSFSNSFFGNDQIRSNLVDLYIGSMGVEWVEFECTPGNAGRFERLDGLHFGGMDSMKEVKWKGVDPKDVFSKLQIVSFGYCKQLTSISWIVYLPCVRIIRVVFCGHMKQLISEDSTNNSEIVTQPTFPSLRELLLMGLVKLESICHPKITFPALTELYVFECSKLKKLPFEKDNIPRNLKSIGGSEEWWNGIEWDDASLKASLQPVFKKKWVSEVI